mmetsp:Transcript_41603/g.97663  ORF Transcript_41603/g.97663 Transcript_41603/m.97663 type:complete len:115 (-) Transcript_41603:1617-1961(-)
MRRFASVAQWIEYCPPKAGVAGSIPAGRARCLNDLRHIRVAFSLVRCSASPTEAGPGTGARGSRAAGRLLRHEAVQQARTAGADQFGLAAPAAGVGRVPAGIAAAGAVEVTQLH